MVIFILALFGLAWGSFVNAAVWRLHKKESAKKLTTKQKQELSILHGRSMCVNCRHTLAWYDLLPVVSWLSLGGKCRYCKKPISWQYPLVELITASLFVLSYIHFPLFHLSYSVLLFAIWLIFIVSFMALAVYDLRWMLLPNIIVYPLIGLAVLHTIILATVSEDPMGVVLGASLGLLAIGGTFWLLFEVSRGKWIGGGDVKLAFMIGLLVGGGLKALLVMFIASLLGSLAATPLMLKKSASAKTRIPFGPFLLLATVIVGLWGQQLIDWYIGLIT